MAQRIDQGDAAFNGFSPRPSQAPQGVKLFWAAIVLLSIGFLAYRSMGPGPAMGAGAAPAGATFAAGEKPTLALFTADWCGPCQRFKSDVLADQQVQTTLGGGYEFVKVDLTDSDGPGGAEAQQHNVRGIPTLIIFDKDGREMSRRVGGLSKGEFLRWINAMQAQMR